MTVQTWPAARKPCTRLSGADRIALMAGGTDMRPGARNCASPRRRLDRARAVLPGGGCFEADGKGTRPRVSGCLRGQATARAASNHPHVAAPRAGGERSAPVARHAQHVAEGAEDGAPAGGKRDRGVDKFDGRHARPGSPGPLHERDRGREEFVESEFDDAVRWPPQDFHDRPRARDAAGNARGQLPRRRPHRGIISMTSFRLGAGRRCRRTICPTDAARRERRPSFPQEATA